jgi:hypothetical protein
MKMSKQALPCFEAMQDLYDQYNLSDDDKCCCAGDFFAWAIMQAFDSKADAIEQMQAMFPQMLKLVEDNWDGLQSRRQVIEALDRGESGGRLQ